MPKERALIIDDDADWIEAIGTFLESKETGDRRNVPQIARVLSIRN